MSFSQYLNDDSGDYSYDQDYSQPNVLHSSTYSNSVQIQIPQYMLNGPPTLAMGGGAEVVPAGLLNDPTTMTSSWFSNIGFGTKSFEDSYASPSTYRPYPSDGFLHDEESRQGSSSSSAPLDNSDHSRTLSSNTSVDGTHVEYSNQPADNAVKAPEDAMSLRMPFSARDPLRLTSNAGLYVPSPLGLPIYSASGFDLISILARVAARPHPQIVLGPVDLTCSFVVVDVRRHDRPIVHASPSFCDLTGYEECEVLGKNCRFLQSPDGVVERGEARQFVAQETVRHLYKSIVADKECQASIINYRRNGQAFINLVTVIPLRGGVNNRPEEADDVVFQVGFQVDLTRQPNAILQKLRDGSYVVNYGAGASVAPSVIIPHRDRRLKHPPTNAVSKDLRSLLREPSFLQSILPARPTITPSPSEKADSLAEGNQLLNLVLLHSTPDFIHVLSLKGAFLYVAPSVRQVLGFEPDELIGKSVSDYCHPADLIPLMRELKESSLMPVIRSDENALPNPHAGPGPPKSVDLLFRAQSKSNGYVWVECRGRLHVEPGKGRKAIILSGRTKSMPNIKWGVVARVGGLMPTVPNHQTTKPDGTCQDIEREFWGIVSIQGTLLMAGAGIRDVLGWGVDEVIGKKLLSFVVDAGNRRQVLEDRLVRMREGDEPVKVVCEMGNKEGKRVPVEIVLYCGHEELRTTLPSLILYQIKVLDSSLPLITQSFVHPHRANVFEELETNRGTSWQYELQQLKFANRRLIEEVDMLESSLSHDGDQARARVPQFTTSTFSDPSTHLHVSHDWHQAHMHEYEPRRSLKRSWDSVGVPSS